MAAKTNVRILPGALKGKPSGKSAQLASAQYPTVLGTKGKGKNVDGNLGSVAGGSSTVNSTPSG